MEFIVSGISEAKTLVREWNTTGQYSQVTEISFLLMTATILAGLKTLDLILALSGNQTDLTIRHPALAQVEPNRLGVWHGHCIN